MKTRIVRLILTLVVPALLGGSAFAQAKIATVHLQRIFEGYYKTKQANSQLQETAAELDKEGKGLVEAFKKQEAEYKKLIESTQDQAVSAEERDKRGRSAQNKLMELNTMKETIGQFQNQARAQLEEKRLRMRDKVLVEIREVIDAKAKAGNYSMVLDVSGESNNNNAVVVLYSTGENDLTTVVLSQLNATAPAPTAEGAAKATEKTDKK